MFDKKKDEVETNILPPLLELNGNGKVVFEDGFENDVEFKIRLLHNGTTTGELNFINTSDPGALILHVSNNPTFNLVGKTDDGSDLSAEQCLITRRTEQWGEKISVNVTIAPKKVSFPYKELNENSEGLIVRFWVTNIYETFRVFVTTSLGELSVRHFNNKNVLENLMKVYRMPTITASIWIDIPREKVTTVPETVKEAKKVAENFLKITRLAQTCWQSIVAIDAFDKINGMENYPKVYLETVSAKTKPPTSLGLTNPAHSSYFVNSAWKGYDETSDEKYGFSFALEWYVDSWSSSVLETKFLCATTALELLMEKFHANNGTEMLLPDEKFTEFRTKVKEEMSKILKSMNIETETRSLMYNGLSAMQRRSYLDKSKMMLDHWKIKYDDIGTTLDEIIHVRNNITHKGRFEIEGKDSGKELLRVYKGLFILLTRIFLAILNYDRDYLDIIKGTFVKFEDVRTK